MIKVNSLDFLNKKTFETDILDINGNIIINFDEKVTPEIILKLYFKNIFIVESVEEKTSINENIETTIPEKEQSIISEVSDEQGETQEIEQPEAVISAEESDEQKDLAPASVDFSEEDDSTKGPQSAEIDFEQESKTDSDKKGPVPGQLDFDDDDKTKTTQTKVLSQNNENIEEKEPGPEFLIFDEKQAEKIANISVQLGKELDFSSEELEKLKQTAYYCNIGLKKFQKEDLGKAGFEKKKAYAGYEIALNELGLPDDIANTIKNHADDYNSDSFPLNTQIPRQHIIGIVCYYENMIMQNKTKQEILNKMLQLGGNKFNIFVLHKFIKMMREAND